MLQLGDYNVSGFLKYTFVFPGWVEFTQLVCNQIMLTCPQQVHGCQV